MCQNLVTKNERWFESCRGGWGLYSPEQCPGSHWGFFWFGIWVWKKVGNLFAVDNTKYPIVPYNQYLHMLGFSLSVNCFHPLTYHQLWLYDMHSECSLHNRELSIQLVMSHTSSDGDEGLMFGISGTDCPQVQTRAKSFIYHYSRCPGSSQSSTGLCQHLITAVVWTNPQKRAENWARAAKAIQIEVGQDEKGINIGKTETLGKIMGVGMLKMILRSAIY